MSQVCNPGDVRGNNVLLDNLGALYDTQCRRPTGRVEPFSALSTPRGAPFLRALLDCELVGRTGGLNRRTVSYEPP